LSESIVVVAADGGGIDVYAATMVVVDGFVWVEAACASGSGRCGSRNEMPCERADGIFWCWLRGERVDGWASECDGMT
jgi:hypothetical protein